MEHVRRAATGSLSEQDPEAKHWTHHSDPTSQAGRKGTVAKARQNVSLLLPTHTGLLEMWKGRQNGAQEWMCWEQRAQEGGGPHLGGQLSPPLETLGFLAVQHGLEMFMGAGLLGLLLLFIWKLFDVIGLTSSPGDRFLLGLIFPCQLLTVDGIFYVPCSTWV